MCWEILIEEHRRKIRQISFSILVWGPSQADEEGHNLRLKIRDYLNSIGHDAKFSEELIAECREEALKSIIQEEVLHAHTANLIVVLYGSRGTQTEFDRILANDSVAIKSIVFVEKDKWESILLSVSRDVWKNFVGKKIIVPNDCFNADYICKELKSFIEYLQAAEYISRLKLIH